MLLILKLSISSLFCLFTHPALASTSSQNAANIDQQAILSHAKGLSPDALKYAVDGYQWAMAKGQVNNPNILTVIDFNQPSNQKRLWVIDLASDKVLMNTYAAHGRDSGLTYAKNFSNAPNSHETSLGVYETLSTYYGHHGKSLRLQGLEQGLNNNAYRRSVVVHSASYMTPSFINAYHRAGRSFGCFALNPAVSSQFMNITKGGSIIFAYASPEKNDSRIA